MDKVSSLKLSICIECFTNDPWTWESYVILISRPSPKSTLSYCAVLTLLRLGELQLVHLKEDPLPLLIIKWGAFVMHVAKYIVSI